MMLRNKLTRQLGAGLALFAASLVLSRLARPGLYSGGAYLLATLLPLFPAIAVGFVVARMVAGLDELQRRIQLHALAFSLATTVLTLLGVALLGVEVSPTFILIVMAFFWAGGWIVTRRRYA